MAIYIFVFFLALLFGQIKDKRLPLVLYLIILTILACRGEFVGIDTENYYNNRFSATDSKESMSLEWLFLWVSEFIKDAGLSSRFCIYFLSCVTMSFLYAASIRFKQNPSLVLFFFILLGYFTHSMNLARQMAACSIMLYAYSFIINLEADKRIIHKKCNYNDANSTVRFIGFTIIAASIHVSAFFFALVYFVNRLKFKLSELSPLRLTLFLCLLFAIVQILKELILNQLFGALSLMSFYSALGEETEMTSLSFWGFFYRSISYIFSGWVFYKIRYRVGNSALALFIISLLVKIILSAFYGNIYRIGLYLSIFDIIIFAKCYNIIKPKDKLIFLIGIMYYSIEYFNAHIGNIYGTNPYEFEMIEIF